MQADVPLKGGAQPAPSSRSQPLTSAAFPWPVPKYPNKGTPQVRSTASN